MYVIVCKNGHILHVDGHKGTIWESENGEKGNKQKRSSRFIYCDWERNFLKKFYGGGPRNEWNFSKWPASPERLGTADIELHQVAKYCNNAQWTRSIRGIGDGSTYMHTRATNQRISIQNLQLAWTFWVAGPSVDRVVRGVT